MATKWLSNRSNLLSSVTVVVVLVWAVIALASVLTKEYTGLASVTPVMLIVCGFLFGYRGGTSEGERALNGGKP